MIQRIKENIRLGRIALGIEKPEPFPPCNCGEPEPVSVHPDQMEIMHPEPDSDSAKARIIPEPDSTPLHEDSILP